MSLVSQGRADHWPVGSLVQVELEDQQGLSWRYVCKVVWQTGSSVGLSLPPQAPVPDDFAPGKPLPVRNCQLGEQDLPWPASISLSTFSAHTLIVSLHSPN